MISCMACLYLDDMGAAAQRASSGGSSTADDHYSEQAKDGLATKFVIDGTGE